MRHLFQSDDYMKIEKRIIRQELMSYSQPLSSLITFSTLENLDNFIYSLNKEDQLDLIPIGTVEFTRKFMNLLGIKEPKHFTYLLEFYKRDIIVTRYDEVPLGYFCKPKDVIKLFTGSIKTEDDLLVPKKTKVYMSEKINIVAEYRYYILNNKILGFGRYDDNDEDTIEPNIKTVQRAIDVLATSDQKYPVGYSLDFGIDENEQTILIEANDGWSLGYYKGTCSPKDYLSLITNRWQQILNDNNYEYEPKLVAS
jgi:hypothetical protein